MSDTKKLPVVARSSLITQHSVLITFLARRWFLLTILVGVGLVFWRPEWLGWTLWLDASVCGMLAVFLAAWGLEGRKLAAAAARPWPALWATVLSYGALPALSWGGGQVLPHADFRVGLILVASVPCTLSSAVIWTRMAGGNEATALLVTLLTNCTSWLITTAWLVLATGVEEVGIAQTLPMMGRLLFVLVLPVGLGQIARSHDVLVGFVTRYRTALGVLARLLTVTIMFKAAVEVRTRLTETSTDVNVGWLAATAGLCVVLHLAVLGAGLWSGKALGFDRANRIAVALAGSQKTLPVSLILFDAYFTSYPLAVVPMVFYHMGQLIVDTFIADVLAGRPPRAADIPTEATV